MLKIGCGDRDLYFVWVIEIGERFELGILN